MKKIRVLTVSNTVWSDQNSFGMTYNALFDGLEDTLEFANIYCNYGAPENKCVKKYCQITEKSILSHIKNKREKICRIFDDQSDAAVASVLSGGEANALKNIKKKRLQISLWVRDLVWKKGLKDTSEITDFVKKFNPDIIFTPMYYMFHTNKILQTVIKTANVPVIAYISDDIYRTVKYTDSPLAMIDRFFKKRTIKKSISMCDMLYVACEEQKELYETIFRKECKVLRKPAVHPGTEPENSANDQFVFLYAGNLGTGRAETVAETGRCIAEAGGILRVYSATSVKDSVRKKFEKYKIDFRGYASSDVIVRESLGADVLLHAEGFGKKDIALTKYSVSTKFPWYLSSGKLILAVGSDEIHTIKYLKREKAAVTVCDRAELRSAVKKCFDADESVIRNAAKCAARDFDKTSVQKMLKDDILRIVSERGDCS